MTKMQKLRNTLLKFDDSHKQNCPDIFCILQIQAESDDACVSLGFKGSKQGGPKTYESFAYIFGIVHKNGEKNVLWTTLFIVTNL